MHVAGTAREIIALELDLDQVTAVRERGWHGLGQPLKSFRDIDVELSLLRARRTPRRRIRPTWDRSSACRAGPENPEDHCHGKSIAAFRVPPSLPPSRRRSLAGAGLGLAGPALAQEVQAQAELAPVMVTATRREAGHPRRAVQHRVVSRVTRSRCRQTLDSPELLRGIAGVASWTAASATPRS